MHRNMHITNKSWNPQDNFCGYTLVSAIRGQLAISRDVSNMLS